MVSPGQNYRLQLFGVHQERKSYSNVVCMGRICTEQNEYMSLIKKILVEWHFVRHMVA